LNLIKLGYYKVNKYIIYYRPLNINIPLVTYFLLEGDCKKYINSLINCKITIRNNIRNLKFKKKKLSIDNNSQIIVENNYYKITSRLMGLLKYHNLNIFDKIFNLLLENKYFIELN
jgi:hypothetical protein